MLARCLDVIDEAFLGTTERGQSMLWSLCDLDGLYDIAAWQSEQAKREVLKSRLQVPGEHNGMSVEARQRETARRLSNAIRGPYAPDA